MGRDNPPRFILLKNAVAASRGSFDSSVPEDVLKQTKKRIQSEMMLLAEHGKDPKRVSAKAAGRILEKARK